VKTDNPSACAAVNWKVCKSAIARLRELVTEVQINPIIRTGTRHFRHAYHPTSDIIEAAKV
jgi:phosphoenolpyruvate carboxylase